MGAEDGQFAFGNIPNLNFPPRARGVSAGYGKPAAIRRESQGLDALGKTDQPSRPRLFPNLRRAGPREIPLRPGVFPSGEKSRDVTNWRPGIHRRVFGIVVALGRPAGCHPMRLAQSTM